MDGLQRDNVVEPIKIKPGKAMLEIRTNSELQSSEFVELDLKDSNHSPAPVYALPQRGLSTTSQARTRSGEGGVNMEQLDDTNAPPTGYAIEILTNPMGYNSGRVYRLATKDQA